MNKTETYDYLAAHGVHYHTTEHEPLFHMGDEPSVALPYPGAEAKNLLLRVGAHKPDPADTRFVLLTVKSERRVDLKAFRHDHGLKSLSFAMADELYARMGLRPGSVTPLGLLDSRARGIDWYVDESFAAPPDAGIIGVHPNDNTATVWFRFPDLVQLLRDAGITVTVTAVPFAA
ncbi:MAG: YbaK/EbsC family protein [Bifidobacteriaceae bacterium]|nr:YbaK/EbsC family protein [Bifidobacteriaceae bacterium]